jgi:hypothetical protein
MGIEPGCGNEIGEAYHGGKEEGPLVATVRSDCQFCQSLAVEAALNTRCEE